jgi:hypothetical protein
MYEDFIGSGRIASCVTASICGSLANLQKIRSEIINPIRRNTRIKCRASAFTKFTKNSYAVVCSLNIEKSNNYNCRLSGYLQTLNAVRFYIEIEEYELPVGYVAVVISHAQRNLIEGRKHW